MLARRSSSRRSRLRATSKVWSVIRSPSTISSLRNSESCPSTIAKAPMASSLRPGTPILRTKITPSGAFSPAATSAATGTPPRGRASTIGLCSTARACSTSARARPATVRLA